MGWTSEMVAATYDVPRKKQDQYAVISHNRAEAVSFLAFAPSGREALIRIVTGFRLWYIRRGNYSN